MTTIILTIIGILLAAAAALMVIFYGGDAFNSGSIGAQANTYQNAGTNVIAATQLYKADGNTVDPTIALLKTGDSSGQAYLKEDPALPGGATGSFTHTAGSTGVPARDTYQVSAVLNSVCLRINKNLKLAAAPADNASNKMGCIPSADAAGVGTSVFFANA